MKIIIDFFAEILQKLFGGFLDDALHDNLSSTFFFSGLIGIVIALILLKREFSKHPKIPLNRFYKDKLFRNISFLEQFRWDFSSIRDEDYSNLTDSKRKMVQTYREKMQECEELTNLGVKRNSFFHFRKTILHSIILVFTIYSVMVLFEKPQLDLFTTLDKSLGEKVLYFLLISIIIFSLIKVKTINNDTPLWLEIVKIVLQSLLLIAVLLSVGNIIPYAQMDNPTISVIAGLSLIAFVFMILIRDRVMLWLIIFPTLLQYEAPTQYSVTTTYESWNGGNTWQETGKSSTALNGTSFMGLLFLFVLFLFKLLLLFIYVFFSGLSLLFSQSILLVVHLICGIVKAIKKYKEKEKDEVTRIQEYISLKSYLY